MTKVLDIFENICQLTLIDLSNLIIMLKKKFPLSQTQPISTPQSEAPKTYSITLSKPGANKLSTIKLIKEICNLSLKQSKDILDKLPQTILSNLPISQATTYKKQLETIGCAVNIK